MKRAFASLMASALLIAALALPAAAVDLSDPDTLLPVDIVLDQEALEIRKVYDLPPTTDPSILPRDPFDREGYHYECSDILREVIIGAETQKITQTETVESSNKDLETILGLLPQEKSVTTEDGFEGTLYLDVDSIHTEPSGYGSSTKPVTAKRSYPNLSSADTNHLPKTITEGAGRCSFRMSSGRLITLITPMITRSVTASPPSAPMAAARPSATLPGTLPPPTTLGKGTAPV